MGIENVGKGYRAYGGDLRKLEIERDGIRGDGDLVSGADIRDEVKVETPGCL